MTTGPRAGEWLAAEGNRLRDERANRSGIEDGGPGAFQQTTRIRQVRGEISDFMLQISGGRTSNFSLLTSHFSLLRAHRSLAEAARGFARTSSLLARTTSSAMAVYAPSRAPASNAFFTRRSSPE